MESEIVTLQKMLKDPKQMEAIASKIVRLAIQNAAEQKKGLEIKNPMAAQVVKAGEIIPPNLSEKAKAGVGGLAAESWEKHGPMRLSGLEAGKRLAQKSD